MREWRIAAIVFALAAAVFTAAGFLPGRVMIPLDLPRDTAAWKANPDERVVVSNKLLSDPMFAFYTWDREARRQLARGEFPWRNVWAADGAHLFANPEAALLFPLTWMRIALGDRGWALYCFLKLFLAGLGMWWLARVATGCDWRSALVAGFAYMASGYMTVWLLWSHTNIYAMLPWLAASAISLARTPSPRWAAATIALAALTTAGGHPETLFYGIVGIAIFIAVTEGRRAWLPAACALIGFALLAVQLVPFAKAAAECDLLAQRRNHPERFARLAAIPATLLPGYLGSPLAGEIDLTPLVPHDRGENFNERNSAYAGLAALIVVLAAWRRVPRAALAIAFAALLLSWHLPLLRVVERIPPLSFGASSRLSLVFPFFVTMCLGAALDGLSCHPERSEGPGWEGLRAARAPRPLATLGVTLVVIALFVALPPAQPLLTRAARSGIELLQHRGYLHLPPEAYEARLARYLAGFAAVALRRIAVPGLALVILGVAFRRRSRALAAAAIVIEMFAFAYGYSPAVPVERAAPVPPMIAEVLRRDPEHRFLIAAGVEVYPPNLGTIHGVRDVRSYDVLQRRDYIAALARYGYLAEPRAFPEPPPAGLAQLGVRWFLTRRGLVELPNAVPRPWPANAPPPGLRLGLAISVAALLAAVAIESLLAKRFRHDRNPSG